MLGVLTSAEVLSVLQDRGVAVASVEFTSDPWDHVVEWVARNEQRVAVAEGVVTLKCRHSAQSIEVHYEVGEAEPL